MDFIRKSLLNSVLLSYSFDRTASSYTYIRGSDSYSTAPDHYGPCLWSVDVRAQRHRSFANNHLLFLSFFSQGRGDVCFGKEGSGVLETDQGAKSAKITLLTLFKDNNLVLRHR